MAQSKMSKKSPRGKRRDFNPEYRAEVVKLCQQPGKTPHGVAKELGLNGYSVVAAWLRQTKVDEEGGGAGALTTAEREELKALRRENRRVRSFMGNSVTVRRFDDGSRVS